MVNVISELQEQMRKFQQEITTRIQEQRALEAQGEGASQQERERSPDVGLGSSDAEDCSCRCRAAGENVGRLLLCRGARCTSFCLSVSLKL